MKLFAIVLLVVFSCGCATTMSDKARSIIEADEGKLAVESCRFVGQVTGGSGFGNLAANIGIRNAKNEALDEASKMGATHVIWTSVNGFMGASVSGNAYNCNNRPDASSKGIEDLSSKLAKIKKSFDDGVITAEEYRAKRSQIIEEY